MIRRTALAYPGLHASGLPYKTMSTDLTCIGMEFEKWQDAVEAAIATNRLQVTGEVRGGQLIEFADPSGAQLHILAVEPFATYAGFRSVTQVYAHIDMLTDVLALCEIVDPAGNDLATVTANLAQGPLLTEAGPQQFQPLAVTALMVRSRVYRTAVDYENETGALVGELNSHGADIVCSGSGTEAPDAAAELSARVLEAEYRHTELTGQRFIHATVDGAFPFDICLPDAPALPPRNAVIAGTAVLSASIQAPIGGCCGGGGGSCGCGGH